MGAIGTVGCIGIIILGVGVIGIVRLMMIIRIRVIGFIRFIRILELSSSVELLWWNRVKLVRIRSELVGSQSLESQFLQPCNPFVL